MTQSLGVYDGLSPELLSIRDFMAECIPFDELDLDELARLVADIEIRYYRQGHVFDVNNDDGGLRILRSGAAELRLDDGQLLDRFGERVSFNLKGLRQERPNTRAVLIEDSLIYFLPEASYQRVRKKHRDFDRFFHRQRSRRLRRGGMQDTSFGEMTQQVKDLMSKDVLTVAPSTSTRDTAVAMTARRISSVLVVDGDHLLGIVTDRDLRSRAVAGGLDAALAIENIMTREPKCMTPDCTLFDATLFMTRNGFHHVPVMVDDRLAGIVTATDLMLAKRDDPVYLVQRIGRQSTVAGIKAIVRLMPDLMVQWVNAGIGAARIGHVLTAVSDAVTERLIAIYIEKNGPAPGPFCWLGFGSQGRAEQLLGGDQDNALLLGDGIAAADTSWFEGLAHWVCDGLNECGYVYCPGDIMATTAEWRQPLAGWKAAVAGWTLSPTADAVMRVSIFFDIRCIYGDKSLCNQLQGYMLRQASSNTIFLAALAENVLQNTPPLGIFRQFVVERNGEHRDALNLKKRGVLPIVDLVRIHALANRVTAVNTLERLKALADARVMSIADSRNLQDALRVIMQTRIQSQVQKLASGGQIDNYINPADLSKLVRKLLRDAFSVVADAQQAVKTRFRGGL